MIKMISILMCALLSIAGANVSVEDAKPGVAVPIIMYHSICKTKNNDYVLDPAKLDSDLRYLKNRGYRAVFVSELIAYVNGKGELPDKPIVLTFDDGFLNNYSRVMPIMKKYGFKYTLSVVGKFIENEKNESVRNNDYSYLNYSEISEMCSSGIVEFGNHTYDWHKSKGFRVGVRKNNAETDEQYKSELVKDSEKCRNQILNQCGIDMNIFTYPFGYYSKSTKSILKGLGYKAILTCTEGINRIERGNVERLYNLKRYNRPAKYTTEQFFKKKVKL